MDINNITADMQLENLYFPAISFSRQAVIADGKLQMNISRKTDKSDDKYKVQMIIEIKKDDIALSVTAVGVFKFTSEIQDENVKNEMVKTNGAAIMFPFIRSQISQLTAQPGMMPIVVPALNITKLVDD